MADKRFSSIRAVKAIEKFIAKTSSLKVGILNPLVLIDHKGLKVQSLLQGISMPNPNFTLA